MNKILNFKQLRKEEIGNFLSKSWSCKCFRYICYSSNNSKSKLNLFAYYLHRKFGNWHLLLYTNPGFKLGNWYVNFLTNLLFQTLDPVREEICRTSLQLLSKFLFTVGFRTKKCIRYDYDFYYNFKIIIRLFRKIESGEMSRLVIVNLLEVQES